MTARAVRAELAVVNVVRPVAIGAIAAERQLHAQRAAVTVLAVNVGMRAVQPETRLQVVVECVLVPADGVVTQRALLAEPAVVRIVLSVARDTLRRRITEDA